MEVTPLWPLKFAVICEALINKPDKFVAAVADGSVSPYQLSPGKNGLASYFE